MKKFVALFALALVGMFATTLPSQPVCAEAIPSHQRGYSYVVPAHGSRRFYITYRGGALAHAEATGNGDIDMYVLYSSDDDNDDAIVSDTLPDSEPMCDWVPIYTHTYTVKVVNCEDHSVTFNLSTN